MPSFNRYKDMIGGLTNGKAMKLDADSIVENTWGDDLASRVGYLYDWYHDDHKTQINNLKPQSDSNKIPIDIKYIVNKSQSFESNQITYHIQMKPSQECNVPYYDDFFTNRYGAEFPVGLYIDLEDAKGNYNKWLVVACANSNDPQFPTYEILRCNYILNIIANRTKYNIPAVLRLQSSYDSGVSSGTIFELVDDKQKFIIPLNRDFEYIYYNQRVLIDNKVLTEPKSWKISKLDRVTYSGLCVATLVQDVFNEHTDYVEKDSNGNVIGLWADYNASPISPTDPEEDVPTIRSEITCSGLKPELKIGGSYKKLTVNFYDGDEQSEFKTGTWKFTLDDRDIETTEPKLVEVKRYDGTNTDILENQAKVKFIGDNSYLGKVITASYISDVTSSIEIEIVSL